MRRSVQILLPLLLMAGCAASVVEEPELLDESCEEDCDRQVQKRELDSVCFPGDGTGELCIRTYRLDPLPAELSYPSGPDSYYFATHTDVGPDNYRAPIAFFDTEEVYATHGDDVKLYPSFRLDEIAQRRVGRWAVVQPHAFDLLQEMRQTLGPTSVISGYRSPGYNSVGGGAGRSKNSRHLWGDAFDFDPPVDLYVAKAKCEELGAYFINLYTTHIHCDWRNIPVDERFFGPPWSNRSARLPGGVLEEEKSRYDAEIRFTGLGLEAVHSGFDEGEPLIEWHAFDELGKVIATHEGESFTPPAGTTNVQAMVAGWLVKRVEL